MLRRALVVVALAVAAAPVCLVATPRAWACSCAGGAGVGVELAHADAVFTGRVVDKEAPAGSLRSAGGPVIFSVDRVYEGKANKRQQVFSAPYGATCGYEFTIGRSYLVFVRHAPEGTPWVPETDAGEYVTGLCSGNRPLSQAAVPDLLGSGHPPQSGGSPDGGTSAGQLPGQVFSVAVVVLGGLAVGSFVVAGRRRRGER